MPILLSSPVHRKQIGAILYLELGSAVTPVVVGKLTADVVLKLDNSVGYLFLLKVGFDDGSRNSV